MHRVRCVRISISRQQAAGYLGENIMGTKFCFDIFVHRGAGAYICGEETALINSLEGQKGQPRLKPPFPAVSGAWKSPTCVNNVETIMALPWILQHDPSEYAKMGTAPYINDEEGRRLTLIEKCRRRWLRNAANSSHSDGYNGKFDDEEDEQ